jgi:ribosome-binding protein aMBF1 (putative translation factor)
MGDGDIATFDQRMAEIAATEAPYLPAEISPLLLSGHSRVSAFRHWRGRSLGDVAKAAAMDDAVLASIEARQQVPTAEQLARLAKALEIPVNWIEP